MEDRQCRATPLSQACGEHEREARAFREVDGRDNGCGRNPHHDFLEDAASRRDRCLANHTPALHDVSAAECRLHTKPGAISPARRFIRAHFANRLCRKSDSLAVDARCSPLPRVGNYSPSCERIRDGSRIAAVITTNRQRIPGLASLTHSTRGGIAVALPVLTAVSVHHGQGRGT